MIPRVRRQAVLIIVNLLERWGRMIGAMSNRTSISFFFILIHVKVAAKRSWPSPSCLLRCAMR